MELTQRSTISAQAAGPRSRRVSTAALVAILTVVAVSEAFIIGALIWDASSHGSIDQQQARYDRCRDRSAARALDGRVLGRGASSWAARPLP